jgi:hypothetical protein
MSKTVQVIFNRPLELGGRDYQAGVSPQAVPVEHTRKNWFYDAAVADGWIVETTDGLASDGRPAKK